MRKYYTNENLPVAMSSSGTVTTGLGFESSTSFEEFSMSSAAIVYPVLQVKSSQQAGIPSLFNELILSTMTLLNGVKMRHMDFSSQYFFFNTNGAAWIFKLLPLPVGKTAIKSWRWSAWFKHSICECLRCDINPRSFITSLISLSFTWSCRHIIV